MPDPTISEVKTKRKELAIAISKLANKFYEETGIEIEQGFIKECQVPGNRVSYTAQIQLRAPY